MNIPTYKRWLSYFVDVPLEVTDSEYHPYLAVVLSKGRKQLLCEKAIYSFDDKYANFKLAFDIIDFTRWQPKNILLLGLGLGSIPFMLEKKFGVKTHYTAVEIDAEVVRLAQKFTLKDLESSFEIFTTDAAQFILSNENKFDLIAVDIFAEDIIPNKFKQLAFVRHLKDTLSDDGLIMYNQFALTKEDRDGSERFKDVFLNVFSKGLSKQVNYNMMLFNHGKYFRRNVT